MKKIILFISIALLALTVNGQVVGEKAIGVMVGGTWNSPVGLSYYQCMSQHSAIEVHAGIDKVFGLQTKKDKERMWDPVNNRLGDYANKVSLKERTNLLIGFSYQPFIYAGRSDVGTHFYVAFGPRARFHLNHPFGFGEKGWFITPEVFAHGGFLFDIKGYVDLYVQAGGMFFSPDGDLQRVDKNPYQLAPELIAGLRVGLTR